MAALLPEIGAAPPAPLYSVGQEIPTQPAGCIFFCQATRFSKVSRSGATRWSAASSTQISGGRLVSSQWRNAARKAAVRGCRQNPWQPLPIADFDTIPSTVKRLGLVLPSRRRSGPILFAKSMFYVYLLASKPYGTLYIGTTSDLVRRVWEHKDRLVPGFTKRYDVERLVWFEVHESPAAALQREKQIKEWKRDWKINLLERDNPSGSTFTQASDFEHCSLEG
ncbi:MAG TPA: GIY-YIG nuclease family protein [Stellaceae bacterium]|jgi:putative endonuclease|nr:GIY-YIG nuclease family protein [Stellaceae bacterium]